MISTIEITKSIPNTTATSWAISIAKTVAIPIARVDTQDNSS